MLDRLSLQAKAVLGLANKHVDRIFGGVPAGLFLISWTVFPQEKMIVEYDNARVLVTDMKIESIKEIIPLLEQVTRINQPLVIIAEDVTGASQSMSQSISQTFAGQEGHHRVNMACALKVKGTRDCHVLDLDPGVVTAAEKRIESAVSARSVSPLEFCWQAAILMPSQNQ